MTTYATTLPPPRRSTRLFTLLGCILTLQIYTLVASIAAPPYRTPCALAAALVCFGAVLIVRRRIRREPLTRAGMALAWSRAALPTLIALELAVLAVLWAGTFRACSGLDIGRRIDGCAAALRDSGAVTALSIAPNGATIVTGVDEHGLRVWRSRDRQMIRGRAERLPLGPVLAFSPDSTLLATGLEDGTVRVTDIRSDDQALLLHAGTDSIRSVAFSADGSMIAAGAWDRSVRVWSTHDGTLLRSFGDLDVTAYDLAFSPDGALLAAGDQAQVRLWDLHTGRAAGTIPADPSAESVAFSPDGALLAIGEASGFVTLWSLAENSAIDRLAAPVDRLSDVAFSPDGTLIAAGGSRQDSIGDVTVWRIGEHVPAGSLHPAGYVTSIAWTPDSRQIAVAAQNDVELWHVGSLATP